MSMHITALTIAFTLSTMMCVAQKNPETLNAKKMTYQDVYPVLVTKNLKACKEFYTKWFDLNVSFESSFFILLVSKGERSFSVGFIDEEHPSSPPTSSAMKKDEGVFLTFQVVDARIEYERLKKVGLKMNYELKDEPWGQRRFGVIDPNGMYLDIVEQIEPQKGFWEKYPVKE